MKKILAFALLVSFIAGAGLIFLGCSDDKKNNVTNGATVSPFEGTWYCAAINETYKFSGSDFIFYQAPSTSRKGTFEYNETRVTLNYTHDAAGNVFTEDVNWIAESPTGTGGWNYSFIDENTLYVMSNYTFIKIS